MPMSSDTLSPRQLDVSYGMQDAGCEMRNGCIGLLITMVLVACGCSDGHRPTYPAGGTVMLSNGEPLPGGWIEFQLEGEHTAPTAKARIQQDGRFELGTYEKADGALEGTHRVMVMPPIPKGNAAWDPGDTRGPSAAPQDVPNIELRYQRVETSGLKFSVTTEPTENRFEIRLETE